MNVNDVMEHFNLEGVVQEYVGAADRIGLWKSEEAVFTKVFNKNQRLLELGCGAGRIALGLAARGYGHITGVDFAINMIIEAERLRQKKGLEARFRAGDARDLKEFKNKEFDGVIFGFNGLMQIPKKQEREVVMREAYRVLAPGGYFVFTTHDRNNPRWKLFWIEETKRWYKGKQSGLLYNFGDIFTDTPYGKVYLHIPDDAEIRDVAERVGFKIESNQWRSEIARERRDVLEMSEECRFWVLQKPIWI